MTFKQATDLYKQWHYKAQRELLMYLKKGL